MKPSSQPLGQRDLVVAHLRANGMARLSELIASGAIAATFERRGTPVPADAPEALSASFANDAAKQRQWQAFMHDLGIEVLGLGDMVAALAAFLLPHARRVITLVESSPSGKDAP